MNLEWLNKTRLRFAALFKRRKLDRDLEDELAFHLAKRAEKNRAAGLDAKEAGYAAHRQFGNATNAKERSRDMWTFASFEIFWQDIRYGARMLWKSPGFTVVATLTLALGIGANAAIFSMVDWLTLRPLPIREPQQMNFLAFSRPAEDFNDNFSYPEFTEIRKQTAGLFSDEAAMLLNGGLDGLTVDGKTQPLVCAFVNGDFFPMLGIKPYLGRFILPSEGAAPGADPVVVLSYRYWKSRFSADRTIIGKKAAINGHPVTIVGVGPREFLGPTPIFEMQAYMPLGMAVVDTGVSQSFLTDLKARTLLIFARLQPGTSVAQAQPKLAVVGQSIVQQFSRTEEHGALFAKPLRPPGIITGQNPIPRVSALFLSLAGLVLFLACLNVANLLLVRASARQREMAVRAAMGAGRGRLLRQLLTESILLALLGCGVGIVVGLNLTRAMNSLKFQTQWPLVIDFRFDWRVLAYAFGVTLITGIFVGAVPALRASRGNLREILHEGARTSTGARQRLRGVLVASQVGGSLALLIIAGLFIRSLGSVQKAELGFNPQHVLNVSMDPREIGYTDQQGLAFYKELLRRVRALPGVQSASLSSAVPLGEFVGGDDLEIPGYKTSTGTPQPHAYCSGTTAGNLKTMGMRLLRGRDLSDADQENAPRVALINEAMAQKFWPGQDPLGKQFTRASDPKHSVEIVGIVNNTRNTQLYGPFEGYFYFPLVQDYSPSATLQLRTEAPPETMIREVLGAVRSLAPTMPVFGAQTMTQALHGFNGLLFFEIGAVLAGALGFLGLTLAMIGVYGVMSYAVSQRTREIGVRMALGAQPNAVLAMIARQGGFIIAAGLVAGLLAAFAVARMVGDFFVGVTSTDPITYVGVSLLLAAVAVLAGYLPARRATRVDPMVALRYE
jgi:predicted permease